MKNNSENNQDPLDQLFKEVKREQDQIAESVELGVEARLQSQLPEQDELEPWFDALWKLCSAGGAVTASLAVWVMIQNTGSNTLTSQLIEQWMLGL